MKLTVGVDNFLDTDPPLAQADGGNSNNYPGFICNGKGRFWCIRLEKEL